jgi:hypothetical protein
MTEMVDVSVFLNPIEQTNALADALRRLGFTTRVWRTQNYMMHPCIVITCGPGRHLSYPTEYVYAAPEFNGDGRFWFWRANPDDPLIMEQIAPVSHVSATADLLARTITLSRE